MTSTELLEQTERAKAIQPSPVCEDDVEKDEWTITKPGPKRSGTILVHLKYGGRRKPIPVDFPEDHEE